MSEMFNNRPLTEIEKRLRAEGKCIACGQPAERRPNGFMFECHECHDVRTRDLRYADKDFGSARASMGHTFRSRLGYNSKSGSAYRRPTRDDPRHDDCTKRLSDE